MENKFYQVFVSSTFEDLHDERLSVMHSLLELNCIPTGMELFPAADDEQWEYIKRVIDQCDYYLLIIAGRYGSVAPTGLSYTEMEYRYALGQKKPIISFLHKDPDSLQVKKTDQNSKKTKKLEKFRNLAKKKMCRFWTNKHELESMVSKSIVALKIQSPATGWVRANYVTEQEPFVYSDRYQVRLYKLKPNEESRLVHHYHRSIHFTVVKGVVQFQQGKNQLLLSENESLFIPIGTVYKMQNPGRINSEIIAVFSGQYIQDDDYFVEEN